MSFVAATITEHYEEKGRKQGKIEGKIEAVENLHKSGMLSKVQYDNMIMPLKNELTGFHRNLNSLSA
jgi:hypothetical protein